MTNDVLAAASGCFAPLRYDSAFGNPHSAIERSAIRNRNNPQSLPRGIMTSQMGLTHIEGKVTGPAGKQATLRFLVDSGATYTLLPFEHWQAIGLSPKRSLVFTLADGTTIERQVSECHIALAEGEGHTPVILGQPGDEALLGIVTLEVLGLILNPFTRTLQPMRMLLAVEKMRYHQDGFLCQE